MTIHGLCEKCSKCGWLNKDYKCSKCIVEDVKILKEKKFKLHKYIRTCNSCKNGPEPSEKVYSKDGKVYMFRLKKYCGKCVAEYAFSKYGDYKIGWIPK